MLGWNESRILAWLGDLTSFGVIRRLGVDMDNVDRCAENDGRTYFVLLR